MAISAAAGLAAGIKPALGLEVAFGVAFVLVTITDVTAGLVLFTIISFLVVLKGSADNGSFMKVAGLLLFVSWFAHRLVGFGRVEESNPKAPVGLTFFVVALALWSLVSATWAVSSGTALTATSSYVLNILLIPIVLLAIRRREQLFWVLGAFVIGAVVSVAYGYISSHSLRLTGGLGDPNEEAAVLVSALPIALGLAAALTRPLLRRLCILGALFCLAGIMSTDSRGGLVALGAVLIAAMLFGGRFRPQAAALLVVVALTTVTYIFVIAPAAARQHVTATDTSGRSDIWLVAERMIEAHPLNGVGSGNFQNAAYQYLQAPGSITNAYLILDYPHVAHNTALELLTDLGVPGLLAFLGVVGAALLLAVRATREFERQGDLQLEILARSVILALIGLLAADFFISGEFFKQLWLLFALCAAMMALARSGRDATRPAP